MSMRKIIASPLIKSRPTFVCTIFILASFGVSASAQVEDVTPPELVSFSFDPTSIDVGNGEETVTVQMRVTDDISGFSSGVVQFRSPVGGQVNGRAFFPQTHLISGTPEDGIYEVPITFPQFSEAGTWSAFVALTDEVSNTANLFAVDLAARGFSTMVQVMGGLDLAPPELVAFFFLEPVIDVSTNSEPVTVTLHILDSPAGFSSGVVQFRSPIGDQVRGRAFFPQTHLTSGTPEDGVYEVPITFPQFSENGTWSAFVALTDDVSNTANLFAGDLAAHGFPSELVVIADPQDVTPPGLGAFSFSPNTINTSGGDQVVTASLRVLDQPAGFSSGVVQFRSLSGGQVRGRAFFPQTHLTSGTPEDGVYEVPITFPQFSETGTWNAFVALTDEVSNTANLFAVDLADLGFPTQLVVTENQAPVAICQDISAAADASCLASVTAAAVDGGSFDPDGDPMTLTVDPNFGELGDTLVQLTVTDVHGESSTCAATLTVVDDRPPSTQCNAPGAISPRDTPISSTSTAADNCSVASVDITELKCTKTKKGKVKDKSDGCVIERSGDTINIIEVGVGRTISWNVLAADGSGNTALGACSVTVAPGRLGKH